MTVSVDIQVASDGSRKIDGVAEMVSPHLFDWGWYEDVYSLSFGQRAQAFDHFLELGFGLDFDPAPLVSTRFVKAIGQSYGWRISDGMALFATLGAVTSASPIGWSPRVIPAWISAQLGLARQTAQATRFDELLYRLRAVSVLSPHPALRRAPWREEWPSLMDALVALSDDEVLEANCATDLTVYPSEHRDLARVLDDPAKTFDHMWSDGLRQNRMKYLGTTAPRWMTHDQLVRSAVMTLFGSAVAERLVDRDSAVRNLPTKPLRSYEGSVETLESLRTFDPRREADPLSFEQLLELVPTVESASLAIVTSPGTPTVRLNAPQIRRSEAILDTDLFTGRVRERVGRVVYSINLGLYDHTPIPPELDDCAYYLLTDAADVQGDLPWRIVRPTLADRDIKRLCLWYKTHPHLMFPEARHSVWIDGNLECLPGSEHVLVAQEALAEVSTFVHPDRDCVYEEAKAIIKLSLDDKDVIDGCVSRMREGGMPEHRGLFETNVLYTKPHDYAVTRFLDRWWRNVFFGSRRDQMSFTFAAFQTGVHISPIDNQHSTKSSRYFRKRAHRNAGGRAL